MSRKKVETTSAPAAIGPYSQAIQAGNLLFLSGQIPLDPATGPEPAVTATRLAARPVPADDLCRTATAEAIRGFENNARG